MTPVAGAVVVTTPQDLALIDVKKAVRMFEKTGVPILGVVENMSYFLCPHCAGRSEIFGHGGARKACAEMGLRFLGEIPLQMALRNPRTPGSRWWQAPPIPRRRGRSRRRPRTPPPPSPSSTPWVNHKTPEPGRS